MKRDAITLKGGWNVEYNYAVGPIGRTFFQAL